MGHLPLQQMHNPTTLPPRLMPLPLNDTTPILLESILRMELLLMTNIRNATTAPRNATPNDTW
jgi:hypothetical protein